MADIAPGLNFRIGADVKGINKAIREAEKSLRGAVSSFSSIGNSLSLALSAPLVAFGALSVKAAGQMESLRFALEGTMKDAGRSVDEARMEMEALRKAAMAPGLDFEQAVKGSVRLQSVGKSAEEARRIIVQLANALALSGGTADQLDGVTKQFAQMVGKGKLMQEDLSIILENMPALAKVMSDTFGTTNAEKLRDMGVSVEDFIAKLTTGMEKLPRAQGGIANSIVNAQNAIQQALAATGEEINRVFNISGALNAFGQWVTDTAAAFKNLDDGTKRLIGGFVVFAATLGPAFKLMQGGVWIVGQLQVAFLAMQRTLAQSLAGQAIPSFIAKWRAMDLVMKASVIGATIAVVLALGAAFMATSKDMSAAAQAQRQVADVTKQAEEAIAGEVTKVRLLTEAVNDGNKSAKERRAALDELIKIDPAYRSALKGEAINLKAVNSQTAAYVTNLQRAAMVRAALAQIEENAKARLALPETADPSFWQEAINTVKSLGNSFVFAGMQAKTMGENWAEQNAVLDASDARMKEIIDANGGVAQATQQTTVAVNDNKSAVDKLAKSYRELDKAARVNSRKTQTEDLKDFKSTTSPTITPGGQMPTEVLSSNTEDPFKKLADSVRVATSAMSEHMTVGMQMQALYAQMNSGVKSFQDVFNQTAQAVATGGSLMANVAMSVAGAMMQSAEQGSASLKDMAKAALGAAAKVIRVVIMEGVARAALSALKAIPFPFNIAAAAAAGAGAGALFNGLIKKVGIPALAEGGVLTGPQLVMAGEYAGARANPEIVTPENKMRDVFGEVMSKFGGGGGTLTCRVDGDALLFVLEKAQVKAGRRR